MRRPRIARVRAGGGWVTGLAVLVIVVVVVGAIVIPWIIGTPLTSTNLADAYQPAVWSAHGSWSHLLGTDELGRDLLQRLAYGARASLLVGVASAVFAAALGSVLGLVAGYLRGWPDAIVSRLADAQLAFPVILMGLSLTVVLSPSLTTVVAAVVLATWPTFARVVRSEVLVLRESEFVSLAVVAGLHNRAIVARHVLPNVLPTIIVLASQSFGLAVIYEAALSYLGVGVQPPNVSLGLMVSDAQGYLATAPRLVLAPTIVLALTALAANILGDWLRERMDPTLRAVA